MATVASQTDSVSRPSPVPIDADWQAALADAVRDPGELCRLVGLDPSAGSAARRAAPGFPLLVPRPYLARVRPGDPADPLLVQVLPRADEQVEAAGFGPDPLAQADAAAAPGLLWKYQGRCLILATGQCVVHCRFCFRRHFPYHPHTSPGPPADFTPALQRIAAERSIREVILSGGDPLSLPDHALARLAQELDRIPHLRRLRLHTRMPVMIPQRVTDELIGWLRATRLAAVVVVHVNHPNEIDDAVGEACGRLVDAGIPVLNQAVLLRGVNDHVEVLAELFERLVDLRAMPYYLHQLDRVAGTAHFEVPVETGLELIRQLRRRLPGYAVPRYVRDTPRGASKLILA